MSDKIQLYSLATPNGQKVSVALEEMGLPYDAHKINILEGDQFTDAFIAINPNSKIPAIVDPQGPGGEPFSVMESGAILVYLAEKSGHFLSSDPRQKNETLQWLFFQMASVGPMFGQFGHFFKYGKDKCDHPYPTERYATETQRLLKVLEVRLEGKDWLMGQDMTIADIATAPWVVGLSAFYKADEKLGLGRFTNVKRWAERFLDRPKVQIGMKVCEF